MDVEKQCGVALARLEEHFAAVRGASADVARGDARGGDAVERAVAALAADEERLRRWKPQLVALTQHGVAKRVSAKAAMDLVQNKKQVIIRNSVKSNETKGDS